ncbi:alpha/beta-hydrolase [Hypoxylon trugodes]|uniref:alpha/beta-hydrolase n=1 Tax=Hypoxylon trugodes TaxID=326681 RepID=UPI002198B54F|nr:alpha/beta-hydrolase [Hypoxylon trugodes]KAI1391138.1 alpha/beta-hydrolase [Hypoxylon trugodes]
MNLISNMATRRMVSPLRAVISRSYSSTAAAHSRLQLAYDHHEPPKDGRHKQDAPIIFMHGLFGSKKNNRSVSRVLARDLKRHVYTVDLRNHGESPHSSRHDYLAMADDVAGFIHDHGLQDTTLIGHSMGAKTAMTLALSQPSLISSLISVDNAPIDAALGGPFARYVQGMRRIDEANVTKQADADKILAEYESELPIRQFLLGNLHTPDPSQNIKRFRVPLGTLGKSLDNLGDFPFKNPGEVRFEKPALFVRGTRSKYVPDEVIPLIGQFFPRFRMVDIEAGHWVISEKPEEFLRAVIEFLTPKE